MEAGRKMMEKWGWQKGQGLGAKAQGITSCLTVKKIGGTNVQAQIAQSDAPYQELPTTASKPVGMTPTHGIGGSLDEPAAKKLCTGGVGNVAMPQAASSTFFPQPGQAPSTAVVPGAGGGIGAVFREKIAAMTAANPGSGGAWYGGAPEQPSKPVAAPRPKRQYVYENWSWGTGYNNFMLRTQEVPVKPWQMVFARDVFGPKSKLPKRIIQDTDTQVEMSFWNTLILTPKSTGALVEKAKKMCWEVLSVNDPELQISMKVEFEELGGEEEDVEPALLDPETDEIIKDMMNKKRKGKTERRGVGAIEEPLPDAQEPGIIPDHITIETNLTSEEQAASLKSKAQDLWRATGASTSVKDMQLILSGSKDALTKAVEVVQRFLDTGEWSTETKDGFLEEKKKPSEEDGPRSQILIKVKHGEKLALVEKQLADIEAAAKSDKLKLTSKPIGGFRTLMVNGTKQAHERVKLMVKELDANGESPMLTKFIKNKAAQGSEASPEKPKEAPRPATVASTTPRPGVVERKADLIPEEERKAAQKTETKESSDQPPAVASTAEVEKDALAEAKPKDAPSEPKAKVLAKAESSTLAAAMMFGPRKSPTVPAKPKPATKPPEKKGDLYEQLFAKIDASKKPPPKDDLYGDLLGSSEAAAPALSKMPGPMPGPKSAGPAPSGLMAPDEAQLPVMAGFLPGPPLGVDLQAAEDACMAAIAEAEMAVCGPGSDGSVDAPIIE